jgi:hypothetical protein
MQFRREFAGTHEGKRCRRRRADHLDDPACCRFGDRLDVTDRQRASCARAIRAAWIRGMPQLISHAAGSGDGLPTGGWMIVMALCGMAWLDGLKYDNAIMLIVVEVGVVPSHVAH